MNRQLDPSLDINYEVQPSHDIVSITYFRDVNRYHPIVTGYSTIGVTPFEEAPLGEKLRPLIDILIAHNFTVIYQNKLILIFGRDMKNRI